MKVVNRIKANEDFALAIKNGRSLKSDSYFVHYRKNELNVIRVGISVSKKLGNAVVRNRIKRQVRAICDLLISYDSMSMDIVLIIRKGFLEKDFHENKDILQKQLSGVLQELTNEKKN